jgi:hypothetical protein
MNLFSSIRTLISPPPPDPKRFAVSAAPWNWNGEYEAKDDGKKGGAILVNEHTKTFEFGQYSGIEIPECLTDLDRQELRRVGLAPDEPYYAKCKAYFAKNPHCKKKDLAANSGGDAELGEYWDKISIHTAQKVLAAFRAFLVDKPTF